MKRMVLLVVLLLTMMGVGAARGDEVSELRQQLNEQRRIIELMQKRLDQLEARQQSQDVTIDRKISKAVDEKKIDALPDSLKWAENVKLSGDFRYRHENVDDEGASVARARHRIRARIGIDAKVDDELDLHFRIASGSSEPYTANQTLDEGFSSKDIWLDRAYVDWHPESVEGLSVFGGKMKNPFYKVGGNQLVWDGDLNPEGIAAHYRFPLDSVNTVHIVGGGFWAEESASGIDQALYGGQAYLKHDLADKEHLLGGISYYDYADTKGHATLFDSTASFGNTVDSAGRYDSDFDIVEFFGEYGFQAGVLPAALYGSVVQNASPSSSEELGWLIGGRLNKAKDPRSWEFNYNYRHVEADAVIGVFTDSDFNGGGTDGEGHKFNFKYQLTKNLQAALTYFINETISDDDNYERLQADLIFKF